MKIDSDKLISLLNSYIEDNNDCLKEEESKNSKFMYGAGLFKGKIMAFEQLVGVLKSDNIEGLK